MLIRLTENDADIQKIIAFENTFERLLHIIEEEGATKGGIIVQDCFQLMHNLLRHNISNQVHDSFKYLDRLLHFFLKFTLGLARIISAKQDSSSDCLN